MDEPDVEIRARAKADEVVHRRTPDAAAGGGAEPRGRCESGSERVNLPERVREGDAYRDVEITFRVAARLDDPE
ncbi:hypothetical protein [Actinomadura yumaensis]|uniref:Uncharacterized protein n=1 Tax=Actinomadura yumaensis TaxID=111807 RepID=A0ABW2CXQ5_9ACTN